MLDFNETRLYVRGTEEDVKAFTIDLTWFHSSWGIVGSINYMDDGEIVLNLIVDTLREDNVQKLAEEHHCYKAW
jgi:hypothetical protein